MEATGRASVFPLPMTSMVMEMAAWGGGGLWGELHGEEGYGGAAYGGGLWGSCMGRRRLWGTEWEKGYGELHGEEE